MYLIKTSFLKFVQHLENAISMLCTKMKCADCLISWIDFESSLPKLNAQILKTDKMLSKVNSYMLHLLQNIRASFSES